ncbi:MAG: lactonase family protein [Bdellovibrionales bacterium]|nr:lactonase family protein [Bdellovibrionales bacterium]
MMILMNTKLTLALFALGFWTMIQVGCAQILGNQEEKKTAVVAPAPDRYLYVASGACYSGGGVTTFTNLTSSNLIYRINTETGRYDGILADYNRSPSNAGDSPVAIVDDGDYLLGLIENTTTVSLRRIERIEKKVNGTRATYSGNITALSAQLRAMIRLPDSYLLVSKSTAAEKVKDGSNRLLNGANPWLTLNNPPAVSACTTSILLISSLGVLPGGNLFFTHAGAATNRFGVVAASGYGVAGNCLAAQAAPNANAFPTASVYDTVNNRLIVAYAGSATTVDLNSIYSYAINPATGAISDAQKIYDSSTFGTTYNYLLFGVSAMALDADRNHLYIATAINTATTVVNYKIERFKYNGSKTGVDNPGVLVKDPTFYDYAVDTKCISSMFVK